MTQLLQAPDHAGGELNSDDQVGNKPSLCSSVQNLGGQMGLYKFILAKIPWFL
jgi:hypothetical protein